MTTTPSNHSPSSETSGSIHGNPSHSGPGHIVDQLFDLGASWARYGLGVGRTALETSAKSLNVTAQILAEIAESFERRPVEGSKDAAASTDADAPKSRPRS